MWCGVLLVSAADSSSAAAAAESASSHVAVRCAGVVVGADGMGAVTPAGCCKNQPSWKLVHKNGCASGVLSEPYASCFYMWDDLRKGTFTVLLRLTLYCVGSMTISSCAAELQACAAAFPDPWPGIGRELCTKCRQHACRAAAVIRC